MKLNSPVTKYLLFALFFLFFFVTAFAQAKPRGPRLWEHPAIKAMERRDPAIVAFSRDPDMLINLCIVDTVKGKIYYVSQYGFVFDTLLLNAVQKKQIQSVTTRINPFHWYEDHVNRHFPVIEDGKEFLRQNGSNFKNASAAQHWFFSFPAIKKAPSTLAKLLAIEQGEIAYKGSLLNFNWRLSSRRDIELLKRLSEGPKPGSLVVHGTADAGYSEYINAEQYVAIRKARLQHTTGEIRIYDWKNRLIDSFFINKRRVPALIDEKTDVFVLYRAWLEWNLQQINAAIPACQYAANYEFIKNREKILYTNLISQRSARATLARLHEAKKSTLGKVDALIATDADMFSLLFAFPAFERLKERRQWNGRSWKIMTSPLYRDSYTFTRGEKRYELADHRGNVMATVSDKKKGVDINSDGTVDVYEADITTVTDYYPFGSQMPERKYTKDKTYRYGFNGKENDNEVKGEGNQQDYGMRIYDPRVGRFLSLDPLQDKYPQLTPYQFASNTPIQAIDLDGLEKYHYTLTFDEQGKSHIKFDKVEHFNRTTTTWSPTWTDWLRTKTTITYDPYEKHIVHGTAKYNLGIDGDGGTYETNVTFSFNTEIEMRAAESRGGVGADPSWTWLVADQNTNIGLTIGMYNNVQAELEMGGSRGSWRKGLSSSPNKQATRVNSGIKPTEKTILYHYTTEQGQKGILDSKKLNASTKANNPNDVRYGDGQYLSDIVPGSKTPAQLSRQFLNVPYQGKKFTHFVAIDVTGLNFTKGRDGVYVIPNANSLDLSNRIVGSGTVQTQTTSSSPSTTQRNP